MTEHKLVTEVRRLAEDRPEFRYKEPEGVSACVYVWEGEGSCIVGQAALGVGLITTEFEHTAENTESVRSLVETLAIRDELTDRDMAWLSEVQGRQDSGEMWGTAVSFADQWVRDIYDAA